MYLLTSALATVAALMLTPLVARMAHALGLVDRPNARTVHHSPTPRVGGMAIVLATALAACAIAPFARLRLGIATNLPVLGLIMAATGIFIIGVLDDLFSV